MSTIQHYNETFLHELERLNPAQREAVDQIEGPVLVIAGPGTGKTSIVVSLLRLLARQGVERAEGLVEQQDVGASHQRSTEGDALPAALERAIKVATEEKRQVLLNIAIARA